MEVGEDIVDKASVVIVIPIYKKNLGHSELASFKRVFFILDRYSITLVCSVSLDVTPYIKAYEALNVSGRKLKFVRFDSYYFSSIAGYNRLLISRRFYEAFSSFEFMLIYQLDCWVFRDELEVWCKQGYDYIGAPWFEGWDKPTSKIIGAGNGGFSLRRIENHLRVVKSFRYQIAPGNFKKRFLQKPSVESFFDLLLNMTIRNNTFYLFNDYKGQEDGFWGWRVKRLFPWFKVAPPEVAMKFSFEANPRLLHELNGGQLPFGCHKWEIYEPGFWSQFIYDSTPS